MRHAIRVLCFVALIASLPSALSAQTKPRPDYRTNPKFRTAISDGKLLAEDQDYDDAIAAYQEANRIAGGKDKGCLRAIIEIQLANSDYDDAIATSVKFKSIVSTSSEKSYAETSRGRALFFQAEPQKAGEPYNTDLLNAADSAFKAALKLDPKNSAALFTDGQALARLGQTEAARAQFNACLNCIKPDDPIYFRAERFAKDPTLALEHLAPAFTITTLDGSRFNLDQMNGRVVLIDFWATWCVPCLKELPQIKQIAKDFAGQPLVILSISWDEDEQTWKTFTAKNHMTWPQYRDTDHRLGQLFEVEGLPSCFTIDSDGVVISELLGQGFDIEGRLKKLIAKAKAEQAAPAPSAVANQLPRH